MFLNSTFDSMANYSVLIERLDCKILEKEAGSSSELFLNYIVDDGTVSRFPLCGTFKLKRSEVWDINLQLSFNSKLVIVLVEIDSLSGENDLGIISINGSHGSGKGSFANKNLGYFFELTYSLHPLFSVELANLECMKKTAREEIPKHVYLKYKIDKEHELRYPTSGTLLAEEGECCYLGLNLQFYDKVFIYLIESSSPKHKVLGMVQLNKTILSGFQHFTNENSNWDFKIIYFGLNPSISPKKSVNMHEVVLQ
jgi:hypothetical protein